MHRPTFRVVGLVVCLVTALAVAAVPRTTAGARDEQRSAISQPVAGDVTLTGCNLGVGARTSYCGSVQVPLDYFDSDDGTITVGFGLVPAADPKPGQAVHTIVAEEGGPGYPSTGTAPDYVAMFGRLLDTHNLLLVDERGTGRSTPINCPGLESLHIVTTTPAFSKAVKACGDSLNHRFPLAGGGFVHASDLFTTANATRDLKQVLTDLNTGPVDLYGDSYGTYFAQAFMVHAPHLLRSVTLDSAYEARDLDPWYHTTVTTARHAFDVACRRSAACHAAAAGQSWDRITRLAKALRAHPFSGSAPGVDAQDVRVTMNVTSLVNIVNDAGYDYDPYRQLDAAARAYLDDGDRTPLLRLYAQDIGYDYSDYNGPATYYSDGQYFAVGCTDYPQLFDMHASPATRRAQLATAKRKYPKDAFAPFSISEWLSVDPFTETYHACTSWPSPTHKADPAVPTHVAFDSTHVPVLILNGELDSLTPAAGGAHIHRQIGADSRQIVTANTVHLVALDTPSGCGRSLVRQFISAPATLHALKPTCAAKVPPVPAVGRFPRTVSAAAPATGNGPRSLRRLASVALAASGDAAIRYNYVDGNHDLGLRGGTIRYRAAKGASYVATLTKVRWTADSTVSGSVTFAPNATSATGVVTITGPSGETLRCEIAWHGQSATIKAAGTVLHAPAP